MAERQSAHRQQIEKDRIAATNFSEHLGQILAAVITLAIAGAGVYLITIGKSTGGLVAIIAPLATLAGVFIYSKHSQSQEREHKMEAFAPTEKPADQPDLSDFSKRDPS